MTVLEDRIEMAESGDELTLDMMFEWLDTEVISRDTAANDYGPKKDTYAAAGVPAYLIVDPYTAEWHLHTLPKDGVYHAVVGFPFGEEIDLTGTSVGLVLRTDEFPRD
ncbi:Uma2 family endonuclease [Streptomyces albogriseolus]|uniref:Uma2 family endonuclease n=1 Tax=Streptomyces albogriseolus TaxID=1887 RepID=UPI00345FBA6F